VIVVPAGASNRIAAAASRGASPCPTTLRTIIPSLLCGRRRSSAPPGHAVYAVANGDGSHSDHEEFSCPKQAVTE
jgi:hypothetical protein